MEIQLQCLLLPFFASQLVYGKLFSRCDLAKELEKYSISRSDIPSWVCLVESASTRNSSKVAGPHADKSFDYGLFQINDKLWCEKGRKGKECNVKCEDLIGNDIGESVRCAKKIVQRHGYRGWTSWKNMCYNTRLPNLYSCFS